MKMQIQTLNEALVRAAPHTDCGVRILDRREKATWLDWSEILRRSSRVAGGLRAVGVEAGDTVGLLYPTGEEFFFAFFGTLLCGAVPVPLYPPVRLGRLQEHAVRTARMLRATRARLVLTDARLRRILGSALSEGGCPDRSLEQLPKADSIVHEVAGDDLALVQFSSGTTLDPKPVALTHRAVLAQTEILNGFWPDRPGLRNTGVSWLPLYHDMGLIGCVLPALERPSVLTLLPPEAFVARPAIWLRTLSRYKATISPAPSFAYGLCVEKIHDAELDGIDLSEWRVALNGAEAVVPSVIRAFNRRFSRWGLRPEAVTPVYGLSEAALAVTFSTIDEPAVTANFARESLARDNTVVRTADGRELVSVGRPVPGFEVQIRSREGSALGEGRVGDIWVRGPSLMEEYLHQPESTQRALRGGWLDTGDLGFFSAGELYITGRAKDVLIVRGSNHAPDEIEAVVSELADARSGCSAAVSYLPEGAEREEIWLFVEHRRGAEAAVENGLVHACKKRVLARTGIALDRIEVLKPGTLPRTSSGKIRRQETLRRYLEHRLDPPEPVTLTRLLLTMGRSMMAHLRKPGMSRDLRDAG